MRHVPGVEMRHGGPSSIGTENPVRRLRGIPRLVALEAAVRDREWQ
jgi:hypothetical protein